MSKRKRWNNIYPFSNKVLCMENYNDYMLLRTKNMFRYENLPETIPERLLEIMLQSKGYVCITEITDKEINQTMAEKQSNLVPGLYAFIANLGDVQDMYGQPTHCIVSNPCLNKSLDLIIDDNCIIMNNDSLRIGLLPLNKRYSSLLAENDITMRIYDINTRMSTILSAQDNRTQTAAENYIKDIEDGKLGIIAETQLLDGIRAQSTMMGSSGGVLTSLIEYQQYLKASWFNELGLQANYNMKRESINSNEAQLNEDALLPLVDDMLSNREEAVSKINEMYGTDIKVYLNSSWEDNVEELELAHELADAADSEIEIEELEENLLEDEENLQEGEENIQEPEDVEDSDVGSEDEQEEDDPEENEEDEDEKTD